MRHGIGKLGGIHSAQLPNTSVKKYSAGVYQTVYSGWPSQNTASPTFFASGTVTGHAVVNNFDVSLTSAQVNIAYQWLGYIKPNYTGTWTFTGTGIDDTMTLWIGSSAITGFTTGNALLNISDTSASNTISLNAGTYYPIRVQYANNSGPGSNLLTFSHTGQSNKDTWTGLLFYNPATNGF